MIKISVEQRHIDEGKPGEMCDCPISLAIKERLRAKSVYVGMRWHIWLEKAFPAACIDGKDFKVSKQVERWAIAFDKGKPVEPFTFRLMEVK